MKWLLASVSRPISEFLSSSNTKTTHILRYLCNISPKPLFIPVLFQTRTTTTLKVRTFRILDRRNSYVKSLFTYSQRVVNPFIFCFLLGYTQVHRFPLTKPNTCLTRDPMRVCIHLKNGD